MVKINLSNVEELKRLPKGVYSVLIKKVEDTESDDGEPMISIRHDVIDNEEFNGSPIYKNFMPNAPKSQPFLIEYLKAVGFSDKEIAEIDDTKKLVKMLEGKRLQVSYKPSKEFAFGTMNNPKPYEA